MAQENKTTREQGPFPYKCIAEGCNKEVVSKLVCGGDDPPCFPSDHELCMRHWQAIAGPFGQTRHACPAQDVRRYKRKGAAAK